MKKHLVILFVALFTMFSSLPSFAGAQWVGDSEVYVNGTWHTKSTFTSLGTLNQLNLGGKMQISDNGNDWESGSGNYMHYCIEHNGQTVINETSLNVSYAGYGYGQYNNNMLFQTGGSTLSTTNINISGLTKGQEYTLVVWFGGIDGQWDSNNNYTATFTYDDIYVEFVNTGKWTNVNAYTWTGDGGSKVEQNGTYPGTAMTKTGTTTIDAVEYDVYTATITGSAPEKIIFNAGTNGIKTTDLTFTNKSQYTYTVPAYRICGNPEAIFGGWGTTQGPTDINPMTLGSDGVFTWTKNNVNIAANNLSHSFRIQINKNYHDAEANADITAIYNGIKGIANNWDVTLPKAGTFNVTVTFNQNTKEVTFEAIRPTTAYTVNLINSGKWNKVYAYAWSGDGASANHKIFGDWPGTEITEISGTAGGFDIYTYTTAVLAGNEAPDNIIFNNGDDPGVEGSTKTSTQVFENGTYWSVTTYGLEGSKFGGWKDGSTYRGIERLFTKTDNTYTYTEKGVYFTKGTHNDSYRVSVNGQWVNNTGISGIDNNGSITVEDDGIYDVLFTLTPSTSTLTVTLTKISSVNISVGALGVGTFCSEYALDFTGITAIKAYTITGETNGQLNKAQVTGQVKAGTGLFIENGTGDAASANADVPTTNYNGDSGINWLKGVTAATHISQSEDGHTNYILTTNGGATVKFYKVNRTSGNDVGAHKAYLHVSGEYAARESMWFGNDETTGINTIDHSSLTINNDAPMYNLAGQKVGANYKGIVIQNGKKLVIK